jgi:hypothetical protein
MNQGKFLAVPNGVEISAIGLTINTLLTYQEWEFLGEKLQLCHKSILFLIGDWLLWGESTFNEEFSQAIEARGYAVQTLLNARWVASRVDRSRRRESLTWSHHLEVASLEPADQERFLLQAVTEDWRVRELRHAICEFKGRKVAETEQGKRRARKKDGEATDFSLTEWTTRSLVKFAIYADACWESLGTCSADGRRVSLDATAEGDFADLLNAIMDELKRREEFDWIEIIFRPAEGEQLPERLDRIERMFHEGPINEKA